VPAGASAVVTNPVAAHRARKARRRREGTRQGTPFLARHDTGPRGTGGGDGL